MSGANWHPASDGLAGTEVYGDPDGTGTYSIYYNHILNATSELLFVLGACTHEFIGSALVDRACSYQLV